MLVGVGRVGGVGRSAGKVGAAAKTYADFVAHITGLATEGSVTWGVNMPTTVIGGYRTTAATAAGTMTGSTWQNVYKGDAAAPCRMVQHGLPDEATFLAQVAAGRQIFYRISSGTAPASYAGVFRNGYSSSSSTTIFATRRVDELLYWDGARAQRMQPFLGLGPTPYDW
ncbi:MAG: hypothetical protein KJ728_11970 [Alphaproteobacteria bacterium]|uniref:Tail protein n=1 Tax=viral metagenome TaxID=1070528 RepID=A0A6M3XDH3_9ZZZZ|nr:hypothetical protein [Alphaproteobacteria bacterium]